MSTTESQERTLDGTEGYVVESTEGDLGWVEEVWVGDANEPDALAVRTSEGRHGLLSGKDVLAVDHEYHWVVVRPEPVLLELDSPRMLTGGEGDAGGRVAASWSTTGMVFRVTPRRRPWRIPFRRRRSASASADREPRLWRSVAVLLSSIALLVVVVATLAFLVARLVTGAAY
jgi:hypothetical protein